MSTPPLGCPVGLEIPAKDVARGAAFYTNAFGWKFAPSSLGLPAHKLQVFEAPGNPFPVGCAMRLAETIPTGVGATKIYILVSDMATAKQSIEKAGGKVLGNPIPESDKGFFQFFEDSEGNNYAIYAYSGKH